MGKNQEDTKQRIVKMLSRENNLTFSEIKERLGMTDRAVSRNLSGLIEEKTIEFTKKGREKHYRIGNKAAKITKRKVSLFSGEIFDLVPNQTEEEYNLDNLFKEIPQKIVIAWFFTLFKGIELGEDWSEGVDFKEHTRNIMHELVHLISYPVKSDELDDVLASYDEIDFAKIKKIIQKDATKKNNFEKIRSEFKKRYPIEYEDLNNIYRNISK